MPMNYNPLPDAVNEKIIDIRAEIDFDRIEKFENKDELA